MAHENLETRHYDNDDHNGNNRGHYDEYHHHNDNKDSFPNHDGNLEDHENEGFSPSFHGQADAKSYRFNNDYSPHSGGDFHGRPNKGGFHNSPGGGGFQNEPGGGGFHNRPTGGDFHSVPNEGELHNAPPDEVHNVSPHEMYHDDRNHGDEMSHGGDYYHNRPSLKDYNNEKESKPFNDDFHEHDFQERSGLTRLIHMEMTAMDMEKRDKTKDITLTGTTMSTLMEIVMTERDVTAHVRVQRELIKGR